MSDYYQRVQEWDREDELLGYGSRGRNGSTLFSGYFFKLPAFLCILVTAGHILPASPVIATTQIGITSKSQCLSNSKINESGTQHLCNSAVVFLASGVIDFADRVSGEKYKPRELTYEECMRLAPYRQDIPESAC